METVTVVCENTYWDRDIIEYQDVLSRKYFKSISRNKIYNDYPRENKTVKEIPVELLIVEKH